MKIAELFRLRWLLSALLIAAAALFAVGIATEGDVHHENAANSEAGEHGEASTQVEHEQTEVEGTGERILGINLESTPLVAFAVFISVALAAATWRRDDKLILLATALFAAAFAALDVAEFSHQIRESAPTIALIAAIIALLHVGAAALAEQRRAAAP